MPCKHLDLLSHLAGPPKPLVKGCNGLGCVLNEGLVPSLPRCRDLRLVPPCPAYDFIYSLIIVYMHVPVYVGTACHGVHVNVEEASPLLPPVGP